jgi:hypothetical protein
MSGHGPFPLDGRVISSLFWLVRTVLYATLVQLRAVGVHVAGWVVAELLDGVGATELLDGWLLELAAKELLLD